MSDTKPTLEAIYNYLKKIDAGHREFRAEMLQFRDDVTARLDKIDVHIQHLEAEARVTNRLMDVLARRDVERDSDIKSLDLRVADLEHSAPTERVK